MKKLMALMLSIVLIGSLWGLYDGQGTFTKINSIDELETGYYVIANSGDSFAMNNNNSGSFFNKTDITPVNNEMTDPANSIVWKLEYVGDSWTIYNEGSGKYVSYTGSSNHAYAVDNADNNNQKWTITYANDVFIFTNKAVTDRVLQYNAGAPRFACYTTNQQKLHLYKVGELSNDPIITVSTEELEDFTYVFGNGPSAAQSFNLSAANLTDNISIEAEDSFEISLSVDTGYASELTVEPVDGELSATPIYVRLKAGLAVDEYLEDITISYTGLDDITVVCLGEVTAATPTLVVSTETISGFAYVVDNGPSTTKTFTIEGFYLEDDIFILVDDEYEISLSQDTGFANALEIAAVAGNVAETTIYVRLVAGLGIGNYNNKTILIFSDDLDKEITLNGKVNAPAPTVEVLQRPSHVDISSPESESAVLMRLSNYPTDDLRYRIFNGSIGQYNCWDGDQFVTVTHYQDSPQVPGDATSSTTWWIIYQRGTNNSTAGTYRDRQGPGYTNNHKSEALPAATAMDEKFALEGIIAGSQFDLDLKYVVLGYDVEEVLVTASSSALETGAFELMVPEGIVITKVEVRSITNELMFTKEGYWDEPTTNLTLPVTFSSFDAVLTGANTVSLQWTTQSESDIYGYYIYRSNTESQVDAMRISTLIPAANTTCAQNYEYQDAEIEMNETYYYWISSYERNGHTEFYGPRVVHTEDTNIVPSLPEITTLTKAYPNPFNSNQSQNIEVKVRETETASLNIFNIKGQVVKTYNDLSAGTHTITWDAKDNNNNKCASGIYFYKLTSPSTTMMKKVMIMK